MMRRRAFVRGFASALVAATWPPAGAADAPARIGFLSSGMPNSTPFHEAFRDAFRALGWVDGRNVRFEYRFAEGRFERLPGLASELVRARVDVIVAAPTPSALAAKRATAAIPVVFVSVGDPVRVGLVSNLARPGGNVTGFSYSVGLETFAKSLELFKQVVPDARRLAVLSNPGNPAQAFAVEDLDAAAQPIGIALQRVEARTPADFEHAFASIRAKGSEAVVVVTDSLFILHRARLAELAIAHRLPSLHGSRENVEAGGLLSYGPNIADQFRRAAGYVDKILRGARPGELPVEQPLKFELVINAGTAKALGVVLPHSLLLRADEVIE